MQFFFGAASEIVVLHEHSDDGPLATLEQWWELFPRPGDGIEHTEPDEMALQGANLILCSNDIKRCVKDSRCK